MKTEMTVKKEVSTKPFVLGSVKAEPKQSAMKQILSAIENIKLGVYLF